MSKILVKDTNGETTFDKSETTKLTHIKTSKGWESFYDWVNRANLKIDKVIYLGKCEKDGECFVIYYDGFISFCKGKLNNGVFEN